MLTYSALWLGVAYCCGNRAVTNDVVVQISQELAERDGAESAIVDVEEH